MAISKEQWDEINQRLVYSVAEGLEFKYKENEIIIVKMTDKLGKFHISIFINGKQNWSNCNPADRCFNPLYTLFYFHINHKKCSPAKLKEFEKAIGKRKLMKLRPEIYTARYNYYRPVFKSIRTLINQFKKIDKLAFIGYVDLSLLSQRISYD